MKKCRVCNTYLDDEMTFCTECGTKYDASLKEEKKEKPAFKFDFDFAPGLDATVKKIIVKWAIAFVLGIFFCIESGSLFGMFTGAAVVFGPAFMVKAIRNSAWFDRLYLDNAFFSMLAMMFAVVIGLFVGPFIGIYETVQALKAGK